MARIETIETPVRAHKEFLTSISVRFTRKYRDVNVYAKSSILFNHMNGAEARIQTTIILNTVSLEMKSGECRNTLCKSLEGQALWERGMA